MTHRSKSTLFLIEQLIVIAVFAICAVACISILTAAYFNATDSKAASHAILRAEGAAEVFKAAGDDFDTLIRILGGVGEIDNNGKHVMSIYYNSSWQILDSEANASYELRVVYDSISYGNDLVLLAGDLTVEKTTGEELVSFPLIRRGPMIVSESLLR